MTTPPLVHYRTLAVDGLDLFYREAGPADAPVLLLHGFSTSSHMFRHLLPLLAEGYRVVAPDLPGFGFTTSPPAPDFAYTFDHLAEVMESIKKCGAVQISGLSRSKHNQ